MEKVDVIKKFLFELMPYMEGYDCNLRFIRFLFNNEYELYKLERIVTTDKDNDKEKGISSMQLLLKNFEKPLYDSIKVNDFDMFFHNIGLLLDECEKQEIEEKDYISSLWLRMGVEDLNKVEDFLLKEFEFLKNKNVISSKDITFYEDDKVSIKYKSRENPEFFETDTHVRFKIEDNNNGSYNLPAVHYALSLKDNNPICYIYGIQHMYEDNNKTDFIDEYLKNTEKGLRNKYASKEFILTMGMFLDLIYSMGIDEVRVPVYQVFNYKQHEYLSTLFKFLSSTYEDVEKERIEKAYANGEIDDNVADYMHNKSMYEKFVDKEDTISYNKTERFINIFMTVRDVFDNIEICNDPFIQGEEMIIKIKKSTDILDRFNKNKEYFK